MSRLLLSLALFGVLFGSAMARMGLGIWESTSVQENVKEYEEAIHGTESASRLWQKDTKVLTGWSYNDHTDYFVYWVRFLPSNISYSYSYRQDELNTAVVGSDLVEFKFTAEGEGETGIVKGTFKIKGSDKTWTKTYEFKEDGNMQLTAKIGDLTMKILFRPTISARAQGVWESTNEGKNLDKLTELFTDNPLWPKEEKFRISVRREGDHFVKHVNGSAGQHQFDFKVNKPGTMQNGDRKIDYTMNYDMPLDAVNVTLKSGGEQVKMRYTHDERGAYGTYKKGDLVVQRFYRRLIPDEFLGTYEFSGQQVNAETFNRALTGNDENKHNFGGAKKIEFKSEGDKYIETVTYEGGKTIKFDFVLGELGHTTSPNGTRVDYFYSYHTKMGRKILRVDVWSTEKPYRYFNINMELENEKNLMVTYHMQHVVAKRWFKKV